ncbi:hypothetical protein OF122_10930 [Pelagibacterium flavum]|uniref:MarR family transcriptional regulator n=1 Tax=Pelagibacterium flavum TaxID=2984530 RepID=A0ABY6IJ07_9HYPH|nr:hypothetical protein [Pelagibacterium sp. YIM 151497]UYQ70594.1 hypothetical protein OF122_10930 [Pelagibacterium sp. YIM 151497]|tara:strand:- start:9267 stop:9413 length:147 start_codon:yes stop_codon:yes gene_type:complete
MKVLPKFKSAISAIGEQMDRIRLYQSFVLHNDVHTLSPAARRWLGLSE